MRNEAVTTNDTRTVHGRRETRRKKNGRPPSTRKKKDRKKPLYSELEEKQASNGFSVVSHSDRQYGLVFIFLSVNLSTKCWISIGVKRVKLVSFFCPFYFYCCLRCPNAPCKGMTRKSLEKREIFSFFFYSIVQCRVEWCLRRKEGRIRSLQARTCNLARGMMSQLFGLCHTVRCVAAL